MWRFRQTSLFKSHTTQEHHNICVKGVRRWDWYEQRSSNTCEEFLGGPTAAPLGLMVWAVLIFFCFSRPPFAPVVNENDTETSEAATCPTPPFVPAGWHHLTLGTRGPFCATFCFDWGHLHVKGEDRVKIQMNVWCLQTGKTSLSARRVLGVGACYHSCYAKCTFWKLDSKVIFILSKLI